MCGKLKSTVINSGDTGCRLIITDNNGLGVMDATMILEQGPRVGRRDIALSDAIDVADAMDICVIAVSSVFLPLMDERSSKLSLYLDGAQHDIGHSGNGVSKVSNGEWRQFIIMATSQPLQNICPTI